MKWLIFIVVNNKYLLAITKNLNSDHNCLFQHHDFKVINYNGIQCKT